MGRMLAEQNVRLTPEREAQSIHAQRIELRLDEQKPVNRKQDALFSRQRADLLNASGFSLDCASARRLYPQMIIIKSLLVLIAAVFGGGFLGFLIPFVIGMIDGNPAWSFVPMITIPAGLLVGLLAGIFIVVKFVWE